MVRNPVVGSIDSMLLSFNSKTQMFVADLPKMAGKPFGELFKWYAKSFWQEHNLKFELRAIALLPNSNLKAIFDRCFIQLSPGWSDKEPLRSMSMIVPPRFPDGIPFGLVNQSSAKVILSPSPSTFVNSGDSILILRPNGVNNDAYGPSNQPVKVDLGEWKASAYERESIDEYPLGKDTVYKPENATSGRKSFQRATHSVQGSTLCSCSC